MRLDDYKAGLAERDRLLETVADMKRQLENADIRANYFHEETVKLRDREMPEVLQARITSLEQTESLLRNALAEEQAERKEMYVKLCKVFAGALPLEINISTAGEVVQYLHDALEYISDDHPKFYGELIERIAYYGDHLHTPQTASQMGLMTTRGGYNVSTFFRVSLISPVGTKRDLIFDSNSSANRFIKAHNYTFASTGVVHLQSFNEIYECLATDKNGHENHLSSSVIKDIVTWLNQNPDYRMEYIEARQRI